MAEDTEGQGDKAGAEGFKARAGGVEQGRDRTPKLVKEEVSFVEQRAYWDRETVTEVVDGQDVTRQLTDDERLELAEIAYRRFAYERFEEFEKDQGGKFRDRGDSVEYSFLKALGIDLRDFDFESFHRAHFLREKGGKTIYTRDIVPFVRFVADKFPLDENQRSFALHPRNQQALRMWGQLWGQREAKLLPDYVRMAIQEPRKFEELVRQRDEKAEAADRDDVAAQITVGQPEVAVDVSDDDETGRRGIAVVRAIERPTQTIAVERPLNASSPINLIALRRPETLNTVANQLREHGSVQIVIQDRTPRENAREKIEAGIVDRLGTVGDLHNLNVEVRRVSAGSVRGQTSWVYEVRLKDTGQEIVGGAEVVAPAEPEENLDTRVERVRREVFKSREEWTEEDMIALSDKVTGILQRDKAQGAEVVKTLGNADPTEITYHDRAVFIPKRERKIFIAHDIHGDSTALGNISEAFIREMLDPNVSEDKKPLLIISGTKFNRGNANVSTMGAGLKLKELFRQNVQFSQGLYDTTEDQHTERKKFVPADGVEEVYGWHAGQPIDKAKTILRGIKNTNLRAILELDAEADVQEQNVLQKELVILLSEALQGRKVSSYLETQMSQRGLKRRKDLPGIAKLSAEDRDRLRGAIGRVTRELGTELEVTQAFNRVFAAMPESVVCQNGLIISSVSGGYSDDELLRNTAEIGLSTIITSLTADQDKEKSYEPESGKKIMRFRSTGGYRSGKDPWDNKDSGFAHREHRPKYMVLNGNEDVTEFKPEYFKDVFPELAEAA